MCSPPASGEPQEPGARSRRQDLRTKKSLSGASEQLSASLGLGFVRFLELQLGPRLSGSETLPGLFGLRPCFRDFREVTV